MVLGLWYINLMHHEEIACNLEGWLVIHHSGICQGSVLHVATTVLLPPPLVLGFAMNHMVQARPGQDSQSHPPTIKHYGKFSEALCRASQKGLSHRLPQGVRCPYCPGQNRTRIYSVSTSSVTGPVDKLGRGAGLQFR